MVLPWAANADPMNYHLADIDPPKTERMLTEYEVRAVYIYKIATEHVTWPEGKKKKIKFCIAGDENYFEDKTWEQIAKFAKKKGIIWETKKDANYYTIQKCDVAYIYSRSESNVEYYIRAAGKAAVLTVGESRSFAYHLHGMIELPLTRKQTVGLKMNNERLLEKGLKASEELLGAADAP